VLDDVLPSRDPFSAEGCLIAPPPAPVVFYRLEDHAKPPASKASIRRKDTKRFSNLVVVGLITAAARLAREELLDGVACGRAVDIAEVRDQFGYDLRVTLRRGPYDHPSQHPAFDGRQRLDELIVGNLRQLGIEEVQDERLDDLALIL
jgi:hypothetical protein